MTDTPEQESTPRAHAAWQDIGVFCVGVWLFFCPPTLDINSSTVDTWTTVGAGLILMILGGMAMRASRTWIQWTVIGFGAVLVLGPWLLAFAADFGRTATINATACGLAIVVLAAWRMYELRNGSVQAAAPATAAAANEGGENPRRAA